MIHPPPLAPRTAHVWTLELASGQDLARLSRWLSPDERARADRFVRDEDRRRSIAARGALRELLGAYLGTDPAALAFRRGPHGKPELAEAGSTPEFNTSHSGMLVMLAFAWHRIGVDVEAIRPVDDLEALARRTLSDAEFAWWASLAESERSDAFFTLWTAKEALSKALGLGLAMPFASFDVAADGGEVALVASRFPEAPVEEWELRGLATSPGYRAALASPRGCRTVIRHHWPWPPGISSQPVG